MNKNVYEPPSSELVTSRDASVKTQKWSHFTLAAFFIAPLVTSVATIVVGIFTGAAISYSNSGILNSDFEDIGEIFVFLLGITYFFLLIIGLPVHWALGKFYRRQFHLYLLAGIVAFCPLLLIEGLLEEPLFDFLLLGTMGAVCFVLFWFIAVHLPTPNPP